MSIPLLGAGMLEEDVTFRSVESEGTEKGDAARAERKNRR